MMKKLLVGTVLCLFVAAAPVPAGDHKFELTVDAWLADVGGMSILGAQDTSCPGPGDCGIVPQVLMNLDDGGTVPAVNFAWTNGSTGNGFALSFYSMDEKGDRATSLTDNANTFARVHFLDILGNGDWWEGMLEVEMSNLSLEWTHELNSSDAGSWQIAFGVNNVEYDQDDLQYMNDQGDFGTPLLETVRQLQVDMGAEFSGFGPSVAISGTQNLGGRGLKFMGDASLAVVNGDADFSYRGTEDPFDLTNTPHPISGVPGDIDGDGLADVGFTMQDTVIVNFSEDRTAFVFDAMLGLTYDFDFGLTLRGGYRAAVWTNMPDIQPGSPRGDLAGSRDVSLSGFFVGAGWTF